MSTRYNEGRPVWSSFFLIRMNLQLMHVYQWGDPFVTAPLALSVIFALAFLLVELYIAPEPVLAPFLLKQKIPVLVGLSNFLVATCNFAVTYFFPMWFQTVMLTSASTAGKSIMCTTFTLAHIFSQACIYCQTVSRCHWARFSQGLSSRRPG